MPTRKDSNARESELTALLHGALLGSRPFRAAFLRRINAHKSEVQDGLRSRLEFQPPNTAKRFDIYLTREEPALTIVIELKRDENRLREDQLREYLSLMGIIPADGSLRRHRNSPKYAQLIVITGATETPEIVTKLLQANNSFLKNHLKWLSWYELADMLTEITVSQSPNPHIDELSRILSEQGYVSFSTALPQLKSQERMLKQLVDTIKSDKLNDEMEVLEATLGRMEFQMAKLNYSVAVRVRVKGRKKVPIRQRSLKIGKPIRVLGVNIRSIGRAFLPNNTIKDFIESSQKSRNQESGVGIAYSAFNRAWVAFIRPYRGKAIPRGFIEKYATREREILDHKQEGIHGWLLKGRQKHPQSTARFLNRIWDDYHQHTISSKQT